MYKKRSRLYFRRETCVEVTADTFNSVVLIQAGSATAVFSTSHGEHFDSGHCPPLPSIFPWQRKCTQPRLNVLLRKSKISDHR